MFFYSFLDQVPLNIIELVSPQLTLLCHFIFTKESISLNDKISFSKLETKHIIKDFITICLVQNIINLK